MKLSMMKFTMCNICTVHPGILDFPLLPRANSSFKCLLYVAFRHEILLELGIEEQLGLESVRLELGTLKNCH